MLAAQTRRIAKRAAAEARRKDKAQQQMDEASTSFQALSSGEDSHSDVETSGSEFECDADTPRSHRHVRAINVVNDAAQRGVKLSSDFLSAARTDEHYQNILQVVEQDRRNKPNLRKRKLQI